MGTVATVQIVGHRSGDADPVEATERAFAWFHRVEQCCSRFDETSATVLYNERHGDYLLVKDDEPALLDYLATLVAKEYVVYNNPRSGPEEFAEEMVRMLVRVRRHLPRKR